MTRFRKLLPVVAVAAAIFGTSNRAEANFQLQFSTNGGSSFGPAIRDQAGGDLDGRVGFISVNIGAFTVTGTSNSFVSVGLTTFDVGISGTSDGSTYDLVVQASFDSVTTAPPPQNLRVALINNTMPPFPAGVTTSAEVWVANGSTLFTTSGINLVKDTNSYGVGSISTTFNATTPYVVTSQVTLKGTPGIGTSLSLDNNGFITPAPAPAGLVLALAGMPALGLGAWLRRRGAAA